MMAPRPTSPVMNSVCGRESSVSPPSVVAPLAIKPPSLSDTQAIPVPTDQQQRLLYQLALAERLRLASAGLAWARPPLLTHQHHHLQEPTAGSLMAGNLMSGLGFPVIGGLGSVAFGGSVISAAAAQMPPTTYPPSHPLYGYRLLDPRMLLPRGPEEPKPQHSYIGLIAMAILSSPDKKLILSDIYQYILDHYPYFRSRGTGWRNSIRHNLSLNDCFMKSGRSANGKGHYWAIHPANLEDFRRGDFRRRRAQRRVRKHMGLAVDDDSEPETISPPPPHTPTCHDVPALPNIPRLPTTEVSKNLTRPKRQFDVLSLLAPDVPRHHASNTVQETSSDDHISMEVTSAGGLLGQNQIHHLTSDSHLRVGGDDLRLQIREVSEDSLSHHLHMKTSSCLPLNNSEANLRGGDEDPPLQVREEEEEQEEVEEKCLPIFHINQNNKMISNTPVGGDHGCPPTTTTTPRESSSPLEYLAAAWHSPTSPLPLPPPPASNSEVHHSNNPVPIIPTSSPTQQYAPDLVSSPLRSYATNLTPPHVNKPIPNLSNSSAHSLNHTLSHNHGPNLPTSHINISTYPSHHPRTSQPSSSTHHIPISLSQGSELHTEH